MKIKKNPVVDLSIEIKNKKIRTGDVEKIVPNAFDRRKKLSQTFLLFFLSLVKLIMAEVYLLPLRSPVTDASLQRQLEYARRHRSMVSSYSNLEVELRDVSKDIQLVGFGLVSNVKTSDLWIWPVSVSTKAKTLRYRNLGCKRRSVFWDVTDPLNMVIIDTVTVDARTVNDKISEMRVGDHPRRGVRS